MLRKTIDLAGRKLYAVYGGYAGPLNRPRMAISVASAGNRRSTAAALWEARRMLRAALAEGPASKASTEAKE